LSSGTAPIPPKVSRAVNSVRFPAVEGSPPAVSAQKACLNAFGHSKNNKKVVPRLYYIGRSFLQAFSQTAFAISAFQDSICSAISSNPTPSTPSRRPRLPGMILLTPDYHFSRHRPPSVFPSTGFPALHYILHLLCLRLKPAVGVCNARRLEFFPLGAVIFKKLA